MLIEVILPMMGVTAFATAVPLARSLDALTLRAMSLGDPIRSEEQAEVATRRPSHR